MYKYLEYLGFTKNCWFQLLLSNNRPELFITNFYLYIHFKQCSLSLSLSLYIYIYIYLPTSISYYKPYLKAPFAQASAVASSPMSPENFHQKEQPEADWVFWGVGGLSSEGWHVINKSQMNIETIERLSSYDYSYKFIIMLFNILNNLWLIM